MIIVELGVNHEGDIKRAYDLMYSAKVCGAQVVKFQLYNPMELLDETHTLWTKRIKIFDVMNQYEDLIKEAHNLGLKIGFSIFTKDFWPAIERGDFLKIAARQLDSDAFHDYVNAIESLPIEMPIICSYRLDQSTVVCEQSFKNISFIGVISKYPHTVDEGIHLVDLISALRHKDVFWGVSLHCPQISVVTYAYEKGASIIEVHFTLDKNQSEFRDHKVSFDPESLENLFFEVQKYEKMIH